MSLNRSLALSVVVTALATPAPAQDWRGTQGRMEGRVVDAEGQPVSGATIKLELPGRGGTTLKTDKKGKWAIGGITSGNWNLDVAAAYLGERPVLEAE
jgi:uncharacterized GH25 family protein